MIVNLKNILAVLLLPLLYLVYSVVVLYSQFGRLKACDVIIDLQYFVLIIFLELVLLTVYFKRENLLRLFYENRPLAIVFFIVLVIKFMKFYLINIDLDLVYFLKIFLSSILEFVPVIPLLFLLKHNFVKILYKIVLFGILILNISSYFYFYNTSELLNPIIFDNVNPIAIKAVFDNFSFVDYLSLFVLFVFFIYIYRLRCSVEQNILSAKSTIFILSILVLYNVLFYAQGFVFSKGCFQYGFEKESKNIIVDVANKNTLLDLIQSYIAFSNKQHKATNAVKNSFEDYLEDEKSFLKDLGLLESKSSQIIDILGYNKIIFLTFESLSNDFIGYYNQKIPKEATYFIDDLLRKYPHLDNFYSANMPTQEGLNALVRSKLTFNNFYENEKTLYSFFDKNNYYTSYLRGISKYYGEDQENAKRYFRAKNILAREELEAKYGSNIASNWGVHIDTVYKEAIDIIKNHNKVMLFVKSIDFHHPGVYFGKIDYPKSITHLQNSELFKSLYWLNKNLEDFFEQLNKNNLFDDKTIVFITADHNPHSSFYLQKFMIEKDSKGLKKIPFIVVTKTPLKDLESISSKYSSQVDILPTFITNSDDFIGKNLKIEKEDFYITLYDNIFTYNGKSKYINFSLDTRKCDKILNVDNNASLRDRAVCKLLHNTNNI